MNLSIVVLCSRKEHIDLVQENLSELELGSHDCELVVMVDNNQMDHTFIDPVRNRFTEVKIKHSSHTKPSEGNIPNQRDRISQVRNESKALLGETDFVFSFEDDTVVPPDAMMRLLDNLEVRVIDDDDDFVPGQPDLGKVGLVSGIQVGRQGLKILGAWFADNTQFPKEFISLGINEVVTPLIEVSGTGMYCYVTPTKLYKEATYGWHEPVGPDVWYGLWLRTRGYRVYVNQAIVCGHKIPSKILTPENTDVVKAKFFLKNGQWTHQLLRQ